MASYTVTTTPAQDRAVSYFVARYNEEHPTALLTADQFIQREAGQLLKNCELRYREEVLALIPKRLPGASDNVIRQILTLLGIEF